MVDAFATADDLATRLNRTFTVGEETWVTTLLEDASAYLRDLIGYQVYPQDESTYETWPDGGRVDIPQAPLISVDAVERDGVALVEDTDYTRRFSTLFFDRDELVEITFTYGYETAPAELTRLACVLVSQALITLENSLGLTAGGLSSVALDDFKMAWADAGASSGMVLPPIQEQQVRRSFGQGDAVVVSVR